MDDFGLSDLVSGAASSVEFGADAGAAATQVGSAGGDFWSSLGNFDVGTTMPGISGLEAPEGGGPGGFWGSLGDFARSAGGGLGNFARGALPFAQLGTAGLGLATGIKAGQDLGTQARSAQQSQQIQQQAAQTALGLTGPQKEFGEQELGRASRGEIPPQARTLIDEFKASKKAELRDYLTRAGLGDSESLRLAEAKIDALGDEMILAEIQREQQLGLQAFGGATSAAGAAAGAAGAAGASAQQQEMSLEQLIAMASQQLGRVTGGAAA